MNKLICIQLKDEGKHITIETAGTIAPGEIVCDIASLSPTIGKRTADPIHSQHFFFSPNPILFSFLHSAASHLFPLYETEPLNQIMQPKTDNTPINKSI